MKNKFVKIFIKLYLLLIIILAIAWPVWHIMDNGKLIPEPLAKFIINFASFPSNVYHTFSPTSVPYNIFDARQITDTTSQDGIKLFTDSSNFSSTNLLISTILSGSEVEVKLIRIPDGKLIKTWGFPGNFEEKVMNKFAEKPRLNHPLMLKDSSIILKESEINLVFSLSKANKINWVDTNLIFHHSIEQENDSTIWIPTVEKNPSHYKMSGFRQDAICAIDPRNGKVKFIKSVADILVENGYQSLLDVYYEDDAIHLNDIQPAMYSSKFWKKGDLLISMRHRNSVALYRPSTNKILWLKTGPWLAQHDCDFVDGKTIMVFGNDLLRQKDSFINGHNDIYFYDFEKNEITKPYTKVLKQLGIKTKSEGRCDLLSNGDLFIDESNNGKLYIINKDSVKMIYTERYDKNHIKMFNWVRPIIN
jgi:hypothetical protein